MSVEVERRRFSVERVERVGGGIHISILNVYVYVYV